MSTPVLDPSVILQGPVQSMQSVVDPSIILQGPEKVSGLNQRSVGTKVAQTIPVKNSAKVASSAVAIVDPASGQEVQLPHVERRKDSPAMQPLKTEHVAPREEVESSTAAPPKRETLKIVDPASGEEVVMNKEVTPKPKQSRALEIVDPTSGVVISHDPKRARESKGVAIIDPKSGEELKAEPIRRDSPPRPVSIIDPKSGKPVTWEVDAQQQCDGQTSEPQVLLRILACRYCWGGTCLASNSEEECT